MVYVLLLFMLCTGYYTFTYGLSLIKEDQNTLGGIATIFIAVVGTLVPATVALLVQ